MEEKEFEKHLKKIISIEERKTQKAFLQSIEKNLKKSHRGNWFMASSITVFLGFGSYFLWNQPVSNKKLFDQYFSSYPNIVAPISRNDDNKSTIETAFENYELENYKIALISIDELLKSSNNQKEILQFYKGICLLNLGKTQESISVFKNNLSNSKTWKDKYLWYLSLAYLKNNEIDFAIKNLKILSKENTRFKRNETLDLLKSLK